MGTTNEVYDFIKKIKEDYKNINFLLSRKSSSWKYNE